MNIKSIFSKIASFFKSAPAVDSATVARGAANAANTALSAGTLAGAVASKDVPGAIAAGVNVAQAIAVDVQDIKSDIDAAKK